MPLPDDFEPAVRDPKKLARTAWVLVGVMFIGGWLILKAYEKWAVEQSADDRPSMVHRIQPERSLRLVRQDGRTADLMDLRGQVFAINVISLKQLETSARSIAVMKRLAESYAGNPDFHLVTLVLDPMPAEELVPTLKETAAAQDMELPQWWVGANEPKTLQTFIRNELKPSLPPARTDGEWSFDPGIALIDRNGHLRRAVVPKKEGGGPPAVIPFDFDEAAKWDAEGRKSGSELTNEQEMEALLGRTIDKLLAEPFKP
jgi:hypothetical protein